MKSNDSQARHLKKHKITKELKKTTNYNVHSELREKSNIFRRCEIGKHSTTHRDMHNLSLRYFDQSTKINEKLERECS